MRRRALVFAPFAGLVVAGAIAPSCVPSQPGNPDVPRALCEPRCAREHDCDPSVDVPGCMARCISRHGPRTIYLRDDYVAAVRTCARQQLCVPNTDAAISSCVADARRRFSVSDAARAFCQRHIEKIASCRWAPPTEERCLLDFKTYSEPILRELDRCAEESPCKWYGRCYVAVLGEDPVFDDPQRAKLARERPAADTPATSVDFSGNVRVDGQAPAPGAKVCLREPSGPCVEGDSAGAFTLPLPVQKEVAVSFSAPGYGGRLLALSVKGTGFIDWKLNVTSDATLQARYGVLGATPPSLDSGPPVGSLYVTANGPPGSKTGFAGVTMSIAPVSGVGPLYFGADGKPDAQRKETSTYSYALFANVQPGVVELSLGPDSLVCSASYGGWPSDKRNTVRVPVAAGLETRVMLVCHS